MCNKAWLGIFLFSVLCAIRGQRDNDEISFSQKVEEFIEAGLACHDNPGLSLAVVKDGEVLLSRGFGHKTLDRLEPVTDATLFGIASLSKAFAATLLLKQIEENKTLSLQTKVKDILGRDNIFKDSLRSQYTTLEDLLAHRLGILSNNNLRLDDKLTRENLMDRLQYLSPFGGFRTSFYYSNIMYGLITYISEVIGGKSWEELLHEKILSPLNMTSTTYVTTADMESLDIAVGYQVSYGGQLFPVPYEFSRRWGLLCGSGCIQSNAKDMATWMMFHLNNGRGAKNSIVLDPELMEDAHKPQNSIPTSLEYYTRPKAPVTLTSTNYGLGWRTGHYRGYSVVRHTGSTYGYRALITLFPDMRIGLFTALTGDDPNYFFRTNIHLYLADLLLGENPWLDNSTICSFPEPWHRNTQSVQTAPRKDLVPAKPLVAYEGLFSNPAYGEIDVYLNDTTNLLMASYGWAQFILYSKSSNDFYAQGYGLLKNVRDYSTLTFEFENDKVASIIAKSFESKDPPVFVYVGGTSKNRRSNCCCNVHSFGWLKYLAMLSFLLSLIH